MEEENLMHNCDVVGTYYLQQLNKLKQQGVPMIGDVRGNCMNHLLCCHLLKDRRVGEWPEMLVVGDSSESFLKKLFNMQNHGKINNLHDSDFPLISNISWLFPTLFRGCLEDARTLLVGYLASIFRLPLPLGLGFIALTWNLPSSRVNSFWANAARGVNHLNI